MTEEHNDLEPGMQRPGVRVYGRRTFDKSPGFKDIDTLIGTAEALSGFDKYLPRGVFRFATSEDAATWWERARVVPRGASHATTDIRLRLPVVGDLFSLCRRLNAARSLYVVVGGWAVNYWVSSNLQHPTSDIDLLVAPTASNLRATWQALAGTSPPGAMPPSDDNCRDCRLIRFVTDVVVDVLTRAGSVTFETAGIVTAEIEGTPVPLPDLRTLVATKDTGRDRDKLDRSALLARLVPIPGQDPS